jgi:hypothetical protein
VISLRGAEVFRHFGATGTPSSGRTHCSPRRIWAFCAVGASSVPVQLAATFFYGFTDTRSITKTSVSFGPITGGYPFGP